MDLSTRVKEVLRGESHDTSKNDIDTSKTPGAFPETPAAVTDDSSPREMQQTSAFDTTGSEHERNKLHKPNDPRGWTDEERRAHGHGYTDSGVGGMTTDPLQQESNYTHQPADTSYDNQRAVAPGEQGTSFDEKREHGEYGEHVDTGAAGTTALGSQPQHQSSVPESVPIGSQEGEHPYWGNLPQGEGVYNTVTGHGSKEDEARRSESGPVQATTKSLDDDAANTAHQRSLPLGTSGTAGTSRYESLNDPQNPESQTVGEQKESHYKEGLAGGAAAGVAAAGAYGLEKKHGEENLRKHATDQSETEHPEDKKDSKMFGLFRRSSKSSPTATKEEFVEPEHSAEKKEGRSFSLLHRGPKSQPKEKDVAKDEVLAQEPKAEKEKKLSGLFHHRSHDDKKATDPEFKEPVYEQEKDHGHSKAAPALALAGAGGATAYAATRGHDEDESRARDKSTTGQHVQPTSQIGGSQYNTLSSGTTSGIQPQDHTSTQSHEPLTSGKEHSSFPAAAGLGAAGLGAGALASKGLDHRRDERGEQSTAMDTSRDLKPTAQTSDFNAPMGTSMGTSSGITGSQDPSFGAYNTSTSTAPRDTSSMTVEPITKHANKGEYNVLSSGTPSGIKIDDDVDTQPTLHDPPRDTLHRESQSRELPIHDTHDKHHDSKTSTGLGAAGLGAAGLGAAAHGRRPEEKEGFNQPGALGETRDTHDKLRDTHTHPSTTADLGATGLGTSAYESRSKPEGTFGESTVPGQTLPSQTQSQTQTRIPQEKDRHEDAYTAAGLGAAGLGAAGLGAYAHEHRKPKEETAGEQSLGKSFEREPAAQFQSELAQEREPAGQFQGEQFSQERQPAGQYQGEQLTQDNKHRDAKAAAVAAFGARKPEEKSYTPVEQARWKQSPPVSQTEERSLPTDLGMGSAFGAGAVGAGGAGGALNKITHRCTNCGEENDISKYFTGATGHQ
ncbi:hypothetical protein B0T10DRAFT_275327 [Thelonectria olida]|uniref:Uncharacterized protein n=1 Tax=Thelonectria olida TaxID=1576542 RepID=A0A9P9AV40_9HYPO|nr:hypothetical protein B0T10DRAFT_275327 [Thelonectria olida]